MPNGQKFPLIIIAYL